MRKRRRRRPLGRRSTTAMKASGGSGRKRCVIKNTFSSITLLSGLRAQGVAVIAVVGGVAVVGGGLSDFDFKYAGRDDDARANDEPQSGAEAETRTKTESAAATAAAAAAPSLVDETVSRQWSRESKRASHTTHGCIAIAFARRRGWRIVVSRSSHLSHIFIFTLSGERRRTNASSAQRSTRVEGTRSPLLKNYRIRQCAGRGPSTTRPRLM